MRTHSPCLLRWRQGLLAALERCHDSNHVGNEKLLSWLLSWVFVLVRVGFMTACRHDGEKFLLSARRKKEE